MWSSVLYYGSKMFRVVRAVKLIKAGANITESSNPILLAKNVTLTVVDCCYPLPLSLKLATNCISVCSLIGYSIAAPNPFTIRLAIHMIAEIYE